MQAIVLADRSGGSVQLTAETTVSTSPAPVPSSTMMSALLSTM